MRTYYKVGRFAKGDTFVSYHPFISQKALVTYEKDKRAYPKIKGSKLFVFLDNTSAYDLYAECFKELSPDDHYCLWEVEGPNKYHKVFIPRFFPGRLKEMLYFWKDPDIYPDKHGIYLPSATVVSWLIPRKRLC